MESKNSTSHNPSPRFYRGNHCYQFLVYHSRNFPVMCVYVYMYMYSFFTYIDFHAYRFFSYKVDVSLSLPDHFGAVTAPKTGPQQPACTRMCLSWSGLTVCATSPSYRSAHPHVVSVLQVS